MLQNPALQGFPQMGFAQTPGLQMPFQTAASLPMASMGALSSLSSDILDPMGLNSLLGNVDSFLNDPFTKNLKALVELSNNPAAITQANATLQAGGQVPGFIQAGQQQLGMIPGMMGMQAGMMPGMTGAQTGMMGMQTGMMPGQYGQLPQLQAGIQQLGNQYGQLQQMAAGIQGQLQGQPQGMPGAYGSSDPLFGSAAPEGPMASQQPQGRMGQVQSMANSLGDEIGAALDGSDTSPSAYQGNNGGMAWGDPHIVGDDGEQFDFMGENLGSEGRIYAMLSDKNTQMNARFIQGCDETTSWMNETGIMTPQGAVAFNAEGALTIDGKDIDLNDPKAIAKLPKNIKWDAESRRLSVTTDEYTIELEMKDAVEGEYPQHLNQYIYIKSGHDPLADGVKPHGIWGQTVDADTEQKTVDPNTTGNTEAKQGAGVVDGTVSDYEVSSLFSTDFSFNRFKH